MTKLIGLIEFFQHKEYVEQYINGKLYINKPSYFREYKEKESNNIIYKNVATIILIQNKTYRIYNTISAYKNS